MGGVVTGSMEGGCNVGAGGLAWVSVAEYWGRPAALLLTVGEGVAVVLLVGLGTAADGLGAVRMAWRCRRHGAVVAGPAVGVDEMAVRER